MSNGNKNKEKDFENCNAVIGQDILKSKFIREYRDNIFNNWQLCNTTTMKNDYFRYNIILGWIN